MLQRLQRLCLARHLAVLAILLMVGIGQHAHGGVVGDGEAGAASILSPGLAPGFRTGHADGDPAAAAGPHCGLCHLIRGLLAPGGGVGAPVVLAVRVPAAPGAVPPNALAPEVPSRPPRPGYAA